MTLLKDVAHHYDSLDYFYRKLWGEHVHHGYWADRSLSTSRAVEALVHRVARGLSLTSSSRVCDIGCGYGGSLRLLAKEIHLEGVGLTISEKQWEHANSAANPAGISFFCRDFLENGLPSESFDAAYAIESSEHMASFDKFLDETHRILRPNGRLAIAAWLRDPETNPTMDKHLNQKILEEGRLAQMYPVDEFISRVGRKFRIIEFEDVSKRVAKTWWICAANLIRILATDQIARDFVRNGTNKDRIFAITLGRILLAYETRAMRYGILLVEKS